MSKAFYYVKNICNVRFSCIFVWNITELAIVPTTCRSQPLSTTKPIDQDM